MDALQRGPGISRSGRVPAWVVLVLGAGAFFIGAEMIGERLYAEGHFEVETDRVKINVRALDAYVPDGWSEFVAVRLSTLEGIFVDDPDAVARVVDELESLPLFRSVGESSVIWPDGIKVEVRLRRLVACVKTGGGFFPVSEDGVILPGFSVSPMSDGVSPMPLIAWDRSLRDLAVGETLREDLHFDALSVALSMQIHLPPEVRESLGSILIDAEGVDLASVTNPGVVLFLSGSRAVLFGRPPLRGHSGELPAELKWDHLVEHLQATTDSGREWEVLDIRFDRANVLSWRE